MSRHAGSSGIPQRPSAAAHQQRLEAGRQTRPGRRPLTPREAREREQAVRIGRALNLPLLQLVQKRVFETIRLEKRIAAELAEPSPDFDMIASIRAVGLTALETAALVGQIADRFGTPRRTVQDMRMSGEGAMPQVVIIAGTGFDAWQAKDREVEHARADAAGADHVGSGPH